MMGLGSRISYLRNLMKLTSKYMQLGDAVRSLLAEGKLPPRMAQNWELMGFDNGQGAVQCPKGQPGITDNSGWYLFDFAADLEQCAYLFDAEQRENIAECVGLAQMLERITREESDPRQLRKWERKQGRPYEGPTLREQYLAKLEG